MIGENEMTDSRSENEKEYIQYCIKYAETMTALEIQLHSCEDPEEIAKSALKVGADFYGGDWCGVVESDLEMEAWAPILGYHVDGRGISESGLHELEETGPMNRWIQSLYQCKPVIISDTSSLEKSNPTEYEVYNRCHAESILAVPFW